MDSGDPGGHKDEGYVRRRLAQLHSLEDYPATLPLPATLMVETTSACNHRCVFCAQTKKQRKGGFLDQALYERVVAEAVAGGMSELALYTTGEPFMDKRLPAFVAVAKAAGMGYVYVSTNGALMTPARLVPVLEAGLDSIKISFNAGTRESYARIHQKDEFDLVLENLRHLVEVRDRYNPGLKVLASTILTRHTAAEEPAVRALLAELVDDHHVVNANHQQGQMVEEMADLAVPAGVETGGLRSSVPPGPCYMLWRRVHVTQEGYLTLCCVDYENELTYADLSDAPLVEAWNSLAMQEWRRRHREDDLGTTRCATCQEAWRDARGPAPEPAPPPKDGLDV